MAVSAFLITYFGGICSADQITVLFDPSQPTPAGMTGSAPPAETANNDFSLWGVQYDLTGGDDGGCASVGGNSLCFGDTIGTDYLGLSSDGEMVPLSLLSDPVLSGPLEPGVALTLTFATPTSVLDFDVAVGTLLDTSECPVTPETYTASMPGCPASVALFDASGSPIVAGTDQWTLPNDAVITEAGFSYSGTPVEEAVITFPDADSSDSEFAIDNLTYEVDTVEAPEPASSLLIGLGLIALGCRRAGRVRRGG